MGAFKVYNTTTSQWEYAKTRPANSTLVHGADVTGAVNGANKEFTAPTPFVFVTVYKNGVRMRFGASNDYTISGNDKIVFNTAPATGSVITIDYGTVQEQMIQGSNSMLSDEVPTGTVNGTNKVFTTSRGYVGGSLQVWINGVKQQRGVHFAETNSTVGTFTMDEAPLTGDNILVAYQFVVSVAGNADTVDGYHANATATAGQLLPLGTNAKFSILNIDNPYRFRAYRDASLTAVDSVNTKLPLNLVAYDPSGNFSTTSNRYTAPVAGTYHFDARFSVTSSSVVSYIMLYVNGAMARRGTLGRANAEYNGHVISDSIQLNAGDYVEVFYFVAGALGFETNSTHMYFSGFLINANTVGA